MSRYKYIIEINSQEMMKYFNFNYLLQLTIVRFNLVNIHYLILSDLNLELNKMKDLLSYIVEKMKHNLIEESFKEDSEHFIQKRNKSPNLLTVS